MFYNLEVCLPPYFFLVHKGAELIYFMETAKFILIYTDDQSKYSCVSIRMLRCFSQLASTSKPLSTNVTVRQPGLPNNGKNYAFTFIRPNFQNSLPQLKTSSVQISKLSRENLVLYILSAESVGF